MVTCSPVASVPPLSPPACVSPPDAAAWAVVSGAAVVWLLPPDELVKRVTTTPMENLIGVSCNDNMTERLRLLCLLFDFSRKEGE